MTERPTPMQQLLSTLPQHGELVWIGARPARNQAMLELDTAEVGPGQGLLADRFSGSEKSKRQITLFQQEHLAVIASLLHQSQIDPALLRRNLGVRGINLLALKNRIFRIGEVRLEGTGLCHPCSKMESALGPGGYNALRGHGGLTARILGAGRISLGDTVALCPA